MDKKRNFLNKTLVFIITLLFLGACILPIISGDDNSDEDFSSIIFYTFDKLGTKEHRVELPTNIVEDISRRFEELKEKISSDPVSDETKVLKVDFVDILYSYGLIPKGLSKEYVVSLLNPWWLKYLGSNVPFARFGRPGSSTCNSILPGPSGYKGSAFFCGVAGYGAGLLFLPIMMPRPRLFTSWSSLIDAGSYATNLFTGRGFIAEGAQFGTAFGFMGIGLSIVYPGVPGIFGFYGYSLFTRVTAEHVETYPPNRAPVVTAENPPNGAWEVPISLTGISFQINDADGDLMSYSVTTDPDIGSGNGYNKKNGVYTIPVSGLEYGKIYSWTVSVSDGEDTVEEKFDFITITGPPFDPFDEGWTYRKKITINHDKVAGNLVNFPVLISTIDSDLREKAQFDGDDILFMDDKGEANQLFHEIESFDKSSGELVAWVRLPNLDNDVDTILYMYYGNSECSSQQNPNMVWDSNYVLVLHMTGSSYNDLHDSSLNNNDVNKEGGNPIYNYEGKIGKCVSFDGNGDYLKATTFSLPTDSSHTGICWIRLPSIEDERRMVLESDNGWSVSLGYRYSSLDHPIIQAYTDTSDSGTYHTSTYPLDINEDTWYFIGTRIDAINNKIIVWLDDSGHNEKSIAGSVNSAKGINIGTYRDNNGRWMEGEIDEIQISNIVRSDSWISTSYNTMSDPSSFINVGPEESGS